MNIIISNVIDIENPTTEMKKFCKKELTYKNPEMEKRKRMGFYVYGMDKEIKLYEEYNNHLYLPVGFFDKLFAFHPVPSDYKDNSVEVPINISSNIK